MVVLMDFGGLFTLAEWWNFSSFFVGGFWGEGTWRIIPGRNVSD